MSCPSMQTFKRPGWRPTNAVRSLCERDTDSTTPDSRICLHQAGLSTFFNLQYRNSIAQHLRRLQEIESKMEPPTSLTRYLYTTRLTLELFDETAEHYECLINLMNTPTAHASMGDFGIRTQEHFVALCESTKVSSHHIGGRIPDTAIYYLVHIGDRSGPIAGAVSLAQRGKNMPPDMGWCLFEQFMSKGIAVEAATEFLRYARDELGCQHVACWPSSTNLRSIRVAEKVGFVEGPRTPNPVYGSNEILYVLPSMAVPSTASSLACGDGTCAKVA